jgi:CDP-glycerol glycerophosphotransferase (TagB/SpsB family)
VENEEKMTNKIFREMKRIVLQICSLIIFPVAWIIPKKKNQMIFIGIYDGQFLGNVKYFFLEVFRSHQGILDLYFLTEDQDIFQFLKNEQLPVLLYPRFLTILKMLRTGITIVDSGEWVDNLKYHFLSRSKKVQLWHGVGLKLVQLDLYKKKHPSKKRSIRCLIEGKYPRYDLIVSTSVFYTTNLFKSSFLSKKIIEAGYSRNDLFFTNVDKLSLLNIDRENYSKISDLKAQGYKVILYTPTFRKIVSNPLTDTINFHRFSSFLKKNRLIGVFKLHPTTEDRCLFENIDNLLIYNNSKDIYPILPFADLLITDYSSIASDFLLLNKPIIFFSYDYQNYITCNRELQFDYNWLTPGPKCYNYKDLEREIFNHLIMGKDDYISKRQEILDLTFKYKDGKSSERILKYLIEQFVNCGEIKDLAKGLNESPFDTQ